MNVFVGGPIQYALQENGFDRTLKDNIISIFQILKDVKCTILSAYDEENFGSVIPPADEACDKDFSWMKACDLYLAILPGINNSHYRSDGTYIELGWASALNKPIIILCDLEHFDRMSLLLQGLKQISDVVYKDLKEVILNPLLLETYISNI